ncbi:MAG TPA: YqgE/AlgH family protein [Terriglobales bacterium]|nr:YqgE/AlgH family protein [Terriglobales bacterium]
MSLRKLCFFTMLATIVAFVAVRGFNAPINKFDVPPSNSRPHDTLVPDASLRHMGQPANQPDRSNGVKAFRAKSEIPPAVFLPVQSKNANDLGVGKLLVASRDLGDPNFAETVILLVHYDEEGVVGLVLNRRTEVPLSRVLKEPKAAKDRSDKVYLGGPVETPSVFALLQSPAKVEGAQHIFGAVYLISTKALFEQSISTRPDPNTFHVYLGYAGWNADQLQKEVELGAWFIFRPDAGTVFNSDPDSLWSQMIRKTELNLAEREPEPADAYPSASAEGDLFSRQAAASIPPPPAHN